MHKSRDEKLKPIADLMNTAAGPCFTVGIVDPLVAVMLNLGGARAKVPLLALILNAVFWIFTRVMLHLRARKSLEGLDR